MMEEVKRRRSNIRHTKDSFVKLARELHGDKFDYSLAVYQNNYTKIGILCKDHGLFSQRPDAHLNGNGCMTCGIKQRSIRMREVIKESRVLSSDILIPEGSKAIPLTQGKYAIIDEDDYEFLNRYNWTSVFKSHTWYCATTINGKMVYMHKLLVNSRDVVDHKNNNGLDNRRLNLRACSQQENVRNSTKRKGCTSIYKGVSWNRSEKKWAAQIGKDYKTINLGFYRDEIDAARAYNESAIKLFGEYSKINIL